MNKKIVTSVAGLAAAAALVAGGGTFASWSDSWTEANANSVGADHLTLSVSDPNATQEFDLQTMYPGGSADYEFFVTSRDGDAVPAAGLTLSVVDLLGIEDGCTNTTGEAADDADCSDTSSGGDFVTDTRMTVNTTQVPTTDPAVCGSAHPVGNRLSGPTSLQQLSAASPLNLLAPGQVLEAGEGICVRMAIALPPDADNASQGDSATFKVRFDLTQL